MNAAPKRVQVVICGAGIAGISAAYFLAVRYGLSDVLLIDERAPLSLTSDKSTECYRNWWPGPGNAMVAMMNRSIALMQMMEEQSGNAFQMNQRGYLYVTKDQDNVAGLIAAAEDAAALGAGKLRMHKGENSDYIPHQAEGLHGDLDGADLITDKSLLNKFFPYLAEGAQAALHVRRAGWLSAQQYGMWMLDQAKEAGVRFHRAAISQINVEGNAIAGIATEQGEKIDCDIFVNAAGPLLAEVGKLMGVEIPVYNELHVKSSIEDFAAVLDRDAPLVICADEQVLEWSAEERDFLKADAIGSRLLEPLPFGAHTRPEGGKEGKSFLLLWDTHNEAVQAKFPPLLDPMSAEIAVRGLLGIIPAMQTYVDKMPRPFIDGGYYTKTRENRPLAGPLAVEGAFVIGAASGYGIMAAAGLAELLALHVTNSTLPEYAPAFSLLRYQDEDYRATLNQWGSSWQL